MVAIVVPHVETAVAGREDERHTARRERVGHGRGLVAVQIHIQHCHIEDLRIDQRDSLVDRGGTTW
jgi:hypothetical protein